MQNLKRKIKGFASQLTVFIFNQHSKEINPKDYNVALFFINYNVKEYDYYIIHTLIVSALAAKH